MSNRESLDLPFGPLTEEDTMSLATSFFDASRREAQKIATERGISGADAIRIEYERLGFGKTHEKEIQNETQED